MERMSGGRVVLVTLVALALMTAAFLFVGTTQEAQAITSCTYYNNASHTKVVGQFGYDCCNNPVSWGRKTAYKECGGCFPCFPPPQ